MVAQLSNIAQFCDDLAFVIAGRRSAQNAADRRCGVDPITACRCNCVSNLPFGLPPRGQPGQMVQPRSTSPSKHTASLRPCGVMGWAAMDQRVIPLEWTSSSFPFVICVAGDIYQGQRTEEVLVF